MLVLNRLTKNLQDCQFRDFPGLLQPGDVLVVNNTRVSAVRLHGHRESGGACEALLMKRLSPTTFRAMVRPAKRLTPGTKLKFENDLPAVVTEVDGPSFRILDFGSAEAADRALAVGAVPLPPYISSALHDRDRYQTVFNAGGESSAAPTAGLHFTPEILEAIRHQGVTVAEVNLEVGVDTFRPVMVDTIEEHEMHGEVCKISPETARQINERTGRCIAVGTTTVRTLESFSEGGKVVPGQKLTKICIAPGYEWQVVDAMLTNFHMPRTTMLLMLAAMTGRDALMAAYAHAIQQEYRFLSFGDCMFITNS